MDPNHSNSNEPAPVSDAANVPQSAATAPAPDPGPSGDESGTVPDGGAFVQLSESIGDGEPIADDSPPPPRKRGRPSKAEIAARLNGTTPPPPKPAPRPAPMAAPIAIATDYEAVARQAAGLWFNVPQLVFGQEWEPDPDEVIPIKDAFKNYFEAEKIGNIPPSWGLVLALTVYTVKRANRPTIRERFYKGVAWLQSKVKFGR